MWQHCRNRTKRKTVLLVPSLRTHHCLSCHSSNCLVAIRTQAIPPAKDAPESCRFSAADWSFQSPQSCELKSYCCLSLANVHIPAFILWGMWLIPSFNAFSLNQFCPLKKPELQSIVSLPVSQSSWALPRVHKWPPLNSSLQ